MAKQAGLGDNFYVGGVDLSGDINSLGKIGGGPADLDVTAINAYGRERLGGLADGTLEFVTLFNVAAAQSHPTFAALPRTDVLGTYCRGTALASPAASLVAKQANYDPTRQETGDLRAAVSMLGNAYGLEWGLQLTAGKRTDTTATNGTGVDFGAATSFGLQAYLHVFSFAGSSVTIKLQESSNDGAGDAYADVTGGGFAAVSSAPGFQRIQTTRALAVERYLRVVTSGTFSSAIFAVAVTKNITSTTF